MKSNIFRQKNVDKMSSPEDLNEYVKATSPKVWIIIVAIILLLGGAIVWSVTARLSSSVSCAVVVSNGDARCYILENSSENVDSGMTVKLMGKDYVLGSKDANPVAFDSENDAYLMHILNADDEQRIWTYAYTLDADAEDGIYEGKIVISSITPITFITD